MKIADSEFLSPFAKDLNCDGMIDRFDLHALNLYLTNPRIRQGFLPALAITKDAFLLDGNDVVDSADYQKYLSQRKYADLAVDPSNYESKFDFNCDGKIDAVDDSIFEMVAARDKTFSDL